MYSSLAAKKIGLNIFLFCGISLLLAPFVQAATTTSKTKEMLLTRPRIPLWHSDIKTAMVISNFSGLEKAWEKTITDKKYIHGSDSQVNFQILKDFDFKKNIILIAFNGSNSMPIVTEIVSAIDKGNYVSVSVVHNFCIRPALGEGYTGNIKYSGDAVAMKNTRKKIVFKVLNTEKCPQRELKPNMHW